MNHRFAWLQLGVISILLLTGLAAAAQVVVGPEQLNAQTLQEVIDALPAGGTLLLQAGTYLTNVEIDKPLTWAGEPGVYLQALDTSVPVITISGASGVVLRGLYVEKASFGISIMDSACSLFDCTIRASEVGLRVISQEPLATALQRCAFRGNGSGIGIEALGACNVMMSECTVEGLGTGLLIGGAATVVASECTVSACYDGVVSSLGAKAVLVDSHVLNNHGDGIRLAPLPAELAFMTTGTLVAVRTEILDNSGWGIRVSSNPGVGTACEDVPASALGTGNHLAGNGYGPVCPADLVPASFSTAE
jgi:hypothetical protein